MKSSFDYIIVGSGIAGLYAALMARDHGSVLVLTKIETGDEQEDIGSDELYLVVEDIRYPKSFDGGRVVTSLVRLEDVPATILDVCGARVPERFDGVSLARDVARSPSIAVQGRDPSKKARFAAMVPGVDTTPLTIGVAAVYDGRFHFLAYTDGRRELYDLPRDPDETENLAEREPAEAARLAALLPPKW